MTGWFDVFDQLAARIDEKQLKDIFSTGNACEVSAFLRKLMFNQ